MFSLCKCFFSMLWTSASKLSYHEFRQTSVENRQTSFSVQCLSVEMKIQQIKYYWGWCHSHKCMKIRKTCFDLPKLLPPLDFQSKIFNNFSLWIDFSHVFPLIFPLSHGKLPGFREKMRMLVENLLFAMFRISIILEF